MRLGGTGGVARVGNPRGNNEVFRAGVGAVVMTARDNTVMFRG